MPSKYVFRVPLLIPLLLFILRFSFIRAHLGRGEILFLLLFALALPFTPCTYLKNRFLHTRKSALGFSLLFFLLIVALFAPLIAPHAPNGTFPLPQCRYLKPLTTVHLSSGDTPFFLLGTDAFGRCVFSRLVYGSRISLSIGILAVLLALSIGAFWGSVAGYSGGWLDALMMRGVDGLLAFPRLFLFLLVVAVWPTPPSVLMVVLVLGGLSWMGVARLVRGQILSLKEREYVLAAKQMGASHLRILLRHLLPNAAGPVLVDGTLRVGGTILVEAALSFLGLGVQPPTASWGNMIAGGKDVLLEGWWLTTFPGLAILITVMAFFLIGEGLQSEE